jgi:hypothetical protein
MIKVSPEEYLRENDLDESLVIKIYQLQEKAEIHLVIDFARTPQLLKYLETGVRSSVPYPRDFRHLVFSGTSDISISNVLKKKPEDLLNYYSTKDNPSITLQFVELQQNGKNKISLFFGTDGTLRFTFDTLEVERKFGSGVKAGDDYEYFEVESGKKFDFYNPF